MNLANKRLSTTLNAQETFAPNAKPATSANVHLPPLLKFLFPLTFDKPLNEIQHKIRRSIHMYQDGPQGSESTWTVNNALRNGHLVLLKALTNRLPDPGSCTVDRSILDTNARQGRVDLLHFVHYKFNCKPTYIGMLAAARFNKMNVVQWLESVGLPLPFVNDLPTIPDVTMVEYVYARRGLFNAKPQHPGLAVMAARAGNVDVMLWLEARGHPLALTDKDIADIAGNGHVAVIAEFTTRGGRVPDFALFAVVAHKQFKMLRFLLSVAKTPISQTVVDHAGHMHVFDVLKWFATQSPPLLPSPQCLDECIYSDECLSVLIFFWEHFQMLPPNGVQMALHCNRVDVLTWLASAPRNQLPCLESLTTEPNTWALEPVDNGGQTILSKIISQDFERNFAFLQ